MNKYFYLVCLLFFYTFSSFVYAADDLSIRSKFSSSMNIFSEYCQMNEKERQSFILYADKEIKEKDKLLFSKYFEQKEMLMAKVIFDNFLLSFTENSLQKKIDEVKCAQSQLPPLEILHILEDKSLKHSIDIDKYLVVCLNSLLINPPAIFPGCILFQVLPVEDKLTFIKLFIENEKSSCISMIKEWVKRAERKKYVALHPDVFADLNEEDEKDAYELIMETYKEKEDEKSLSQINRQILIETRAEIIQMRATLASIRSHGNSSSSSGSGDPIIVMKEEVEKMSDSDIITLLHNSTEELNRLKNEFSKITS